MKTMKLFSMAAVALLMAACSNSDDFDVQKPAETAGVYHFEATIAAPNADASMRTVYTEEGTTINVKWKVGDQIALVHNGEVDVAEVKTVDNVTGNATIEADINGSPKDNDDVYLAYPANAVVSATTYGSFPFTPNPDIFDKVQYHQEGTLEFIQNNLDLRMGSGKLAVSGDKVTLKESVSIPSLICIWKLTLQDESSNALSATKLKFINNTDTQAKATSAAKSVYYLCVVPSFFPDPSGTFSFEATVGSDTYTFSTTGLSLTAGKYYQSTVTMAKLTDLSTISSNYEAKDGEILTGTLANNVKISIADGATVMLKDVNINGSGTWTDGNYAGITCVGDATIILEGTNTVKGFNEKYPGIFVSSGKTLVINGTGELNASSNTGTGGAGIGGGNKMDCGNIEIQSGTVTATGNEYGAGIGGGHDTNCGNINISGGTVTATGGYRAAGIGSGRTWDYGSCGNITISGGTVTATGGDDAAGIGGGRGYNSGYQSSCGTITITTGVTKVTATKGSGATNSIGAGNVGTCGTVTIGGTEYWDGSAYKNGGDTYLTTSPLVYPAP